MVGYSQDIENTLLKKKIGKLVIYDFQRYLIQASLQYPFLINISPNLNFPQLNPLQYPLNINTTLFFSEENVPFVELINSVPAFPVLHIGIRSYGKPSCNFASNSANLPLNIFYLGSIIQYSEAFHVHQHRSA